MKILAIETSCDESAISIVEGNGGFENLSFSLVGDALNSQVDIHKEYGGVFPNLAKRAHQENLVPLLKIALEKASMLTLVETQDCDVTDILERERSLFEKFEEIKVIEKPDIDYIAVTYGPGLEPALWVGINFARALSRLWNIPVIPTNHMEGHIASILFENESTVIFPALALLVSGGHTELDLITSWGDYTHVGGTRDDAIGEAFDKVARLMDLPYPGGPEISRLAQMHREASLEHEEQWDLPRPMIHSGDFDFSFSGIKTAVMYAIKEKGKLTNEDKQALAREFEDAVIEVIVTKTKKALEEHNTTSLIVGGGVIANKQLRSELQKLDVNLFLPRFELATDNATMIAMAAYLNTEKKSYDIAPEITANGNLHL